MRYSREYLDRLSGTTGFPPAGLERIVRLERFLGQVTAHPFLGSRLVLKGGTALNLFYAEAPRLSVDLDFNYVGTEEREGTLRERPEIERAIETIAAGDWYHVQRAAEAHAGRKIYLAYLNALDTRDRMEVDLNYMFRVPLAASMLREGWTPDPDLPCRARIAGFEEVMAGKVLALLDRAAVRDLYDSAWFVRTPPEHDAVLFRRLCVGLSGVLPRPLTEYDASRLRLDQRQIDRELQPLLRGDSRPDADELVRLVGRLVSSLANLSADEKRYVDELQWGEFHPELVTGDDNDLAHRLERHPALLWKLENARKRSRG